MKYDSESHLSTLAECWISRAAGRQRRGRAGRTQPGICYKLYTRQEECNMEDFSVPEIHRIPLENVILYAKTIHQGENTRVWPSNRWKAVIKFILQAFLGCAIDPPKDAAFDIAWNNLVDLGAVELSGQMTALGRYIVRKLISVRGPLHKTQTGRASRRCQACKGKTLTLHCNQKLSPPRCLYWAPSFSVWTQFSLS